jgi:hypothetical protein
MQKMSERVELWLEALSFILIALSMYLWHRAAKVPALPAQPSVMLSWQSRLHARAALAAAAAAVCLALLMAAEAIEAIFGN